MSHDDPIFHPERSYHYGASVPRKGEQPLPKKTKTKYVKDYLLDVILESHCSSEKKRKKLIKYVEERSEIGKGRYGMYLQVQNGRDVFRDALEEVFDALMYFTQMKIGGKNAELRKLGGISALKMYDVWTHMMLEREKYER